MHSPSVFPDPCVNPVWFLSDFKHARPSLNRIGAVPAEPSLPSEPKSDVLVRAIVVVVVVMSRQDPLHCRLLLDRSEKPRVHRSTTHFLSLVAKERVVVVEVHIFREWDVQEKETLAFGRIRNFTVLGSEPFDLVWSHTVPAFFI